jgi:hypothetical protein
VCSITSACAHI